MARGKQTRGCTSYESHQQEAFWESHPELLGLVLSHLPDEERCMVIPCVSRSWLEIHKEYPPKRSHWSFKTLKPVTLPTVAWFHRIARFLVNVKVDIEMEKTGYLAQLVCLAASHAPNLTTLTLGGMGLDQPVLHSLAFLTQIQELNLEDWAFPKDPNGTAGIRGLSCLHSLREISFEYIHIDHVTVKSADCFWEALSRLPLLTSVRLEDTLGRCRLVDGSAQYLFYSLTKMTKLSALWVSYSPDIMDQDIDLCPAFASLTQLKNLHFKYYLSYEAHRPVMELPFLENLSLNFCGDEIISNMHVASPYLTALETFGSIASSVSDYLPPGTPYLSCLQSLALAQAGVYLFPETLASKLTSLVDLDLQGNRFDRLPGALAHITTLRSLDLSNNRFLELVKEDAAVIGALSSLETLELYMTWPDLSWTAESLQAIVHWESKFPGIEFKR